MSEFDCPNDPGCEHASMFHDIDTYEDPKPMCCVEGCKCGKSADFDAPNGLDTWDF